MPFEVINGRNSRMGHAGESVNLSSFIYPKSQNWVVLRKQQCKSHN